MGYSSEILRATNNTTFTATSTIPSTASIITTIELNQNSFSESRLQRYPGGNTV